MEAGERLQLDDRRPALKHITNACGAVCKGFVSGDWGLPAGRKLLEDLSPEEMLPPAEKMPAVESVEEARSYSQRTEPLPSR